MRPTRITLPLIAPALILALPLALAACDKGPSVSATNATTAEVQAKVAAAGGGENAFMVEPGRWEGSMTMHDIQLAGMEGMPAEAKAQMMKEMGTAKPFISCVTPEDVKANKAFFTGGETKSCKYDHFNLAGGKVDAAMACNEPNGAKMTMTMSGAYTPQSYTMEMASKTTGNTPMAMSMKMSIAAKRVGMCKGTPDES